MTKRSFPDRQGESGQRWNYHDVADGEVDLVADGTGRVPVETAAQDRMADWFAVPFAELAKRAPKIPEEG